MSRVTTRAIPEQGIDAFIESIRPETMRDASRLRQIAQAREDRESADARLRAAVAEAREAGDSWTMIGLALRTSKQNAFRKYGTPTTTAPSERTKPTPGPSLSVHDVRDIRLSDQR